MIPKKIRRTITVDDVRYEYCVTGFVTVFFHNLKTNERFDWYQDWKAKWKQAIKPSDIATLIRSKELWGTKARTLWSNKEILDIAING